MAAMERLERAHSVSHRSGGGGSEFFICFTARPSSSASSSSAAMRVPSSKSHMSPGRGRDPSVPSLSASLSRRLRSSGSVKGGQSPMFPSGVAASGGGRRKGCAFEAAEPSSPKVTCIGQVRVKSKKNSKGVPVARSKSQREASFRLTSEQEKRGEGEKNQSWVYQLPVSICEALRAFGSEFNCLVPCRGGRSPCSSRARDGRGGGAKRPSRGTRSCGAVFARWLMAIEEEEGEEGKRGEVVGLVVEGRDKEEVGFLVRKMETELEVLGIEEGAEKKEETVALAVAVEEGRVSVCVPPRNALLLMRCRSDPVRVAALADRFWGSPAAAMVPCDGTKEEDDDVSEAEEEYGHDHTTEQEADEEVAEDLEAQPEVEAAAERSLKGVSFAVEREGENVAEEEITVEEEGLQGSPDENEEAGICKEAISIDILEKQRKNPPKDLGVEAAKELTQLQELGKESKVETFFPEREGEIIGRRSSICYSSKAKEGGRRRSSSYKEKDRRRHSFSSEGESTRYSFSSQREARRASFSADREGRRRWSFCLEKEELTLKDNDIASSVAAEAEHNKEEDVSTGSKVIRGTIELNKPNSTDENQVVMADEEKEGEEGGWVEKRRDGELPDCLLMMMMYEPKLSMEVSKETWVCSTDFDRWRPHHPHPNQNQVPTNASVVGGDDDCSKNKMEMVPASKPASPLPSAPAMASAVEQKVMASTAAPPPPPAYGPFVLTRCKSEPVRSSARLAPDACFWRSRHLPIGAEGIGF